MSLRENKAERNPKWVTLKQWAIRQGIRVFDDEDGLTLGAGKYSRTWSLSELPDPSELFDWRPQSIPAICITGTNGKTTTSRLLSAIATAAGHTVGMTSSDGVLIDGKLTAKGIGPVLVQREWCYVTLRLILRYWKQHAVVLCVVGL